MRYVHYVEACVVRSVNMDQFIQVMMAGRMKDVPIIVILAVIIVSKLFADAQYGSPEYYYTYYVAQDDIDASTRGTTTTSSLQLYWMNGSEVRYLEAYQRPEDSIVVVIANVIHVYKINTAAVFAKTMIGDLQYWLSNDAVLGNLTVDPNSGVNGRYNVTILEIPSENTSIFKDEDNGSKIIVVDGPKGPNYPLYLMVNKNSNYIMATSNISEATEFQQLPISFSKRCLP